MVAVVDVSTDAQYFAYQLKYDSVHCPFEAEVKAGDSALIVDGKSIRVLAETAPEKLPWKELKVDIVIGMGSAIDDIHHGARKNMSICPANIAVKGDS